MTRIQFLEGAMKGLFEGFCYKPLDRFLMVLHFLSTRWNSYTTMIVTLLLKQGLRPPMAELGITGYRQQCEENHKWNVKYKQITSIRNEVSTRH
jgi:hypothetical protein